MNKPDTIWCRDSSRYATPDINWSYHSVACIQKNIAIRFLPIYVTEDRK